MECIICKTYTDLPYTLSCSCRAIYCPVCSLQIEATKKCPLCNREDATLRRRVAREIIDLAVSTRIFTCKFCGNHAPEAVSTHYTQAEWDEHKKTCRFMARPCSVCEMVGYYGPAQKHESLMECIAALKEALPPGLVAKKV